VKTILDHIYLQIKHIVLALGPLLYRIRGTGVGSQVWQQMRKGPLLQRARKGRSLEWV